MNASLHTAAIALTALCICAGPALADGDPSTDNVPRVLPYHGLLELDGRPLNATGDDALAMEFALYDSRDAEAAVYRQPITVDVFAGRFTVTIGPVGVGPDGGEVAITDVVAAADDLHLGMTLLGDVNDPEDDIALSNRQRIHATPYAMWTSTATDLTVARDLTVAGNAEVAGDLTVGGALVLPAGALSGREIADGSLTLADLDPATIGEGLRRQGDAVTVDGGFLDARIRSWVRSHCTVRLGWRDSCNNCANGPAKAVAVRADGVCTAAFGSDTRCRDNNRWGGVNTDGGVNNDDVFYIQLVCD